jgi:hypothetical protein
MEYIAFKALISKGSTLYSPQQGTPWMYDLQGRPCLTTTNDQVDEGYGIFASTWDEAAGYGDEIYMVVPYLVAGGDPVIALGTHGWRSSQATVIAGPWSIGDKKGMRQAAEFILASYQQGYRQVPGISLWAIIISDAVCADMLPILEWGIEQEDWDTQMNTILAAGKIGAPAVHILERAMQYPYLREEAAIAAGQIGAPALHILERAIKDEKAHVRWYAMVAASKIGPFALHILERGMSDDDPQIRKEAKRRWQSVRARALRPGARNAGL